MRFRILAVGVRRSNFSFNCVTICTRISSKDCFCKGYLQVCMIVPEKWPQTGYNESLNNSGYKHFIFSIVGSSSSSSLYWNVVRTESSKLVVVGDLSRHISSVVFQLMESSFEQRLVIRLSLSVRVMW